MPSATKVKTPTTTTTTTTTLVVFFLFLLLLICCCSCSCSSSSSYYCVNFHLFIFHSWPFFNSCCSRVAVMLCFCFWCQSLLVLLSVVFVFVLGRLCGTFLCHLSLVVLSVVVALPVSPAVLFPSCCTCSCSSRCFSSCHSCLVFLLCRFCDAEKATE